jgi:hypothetical protein
MQPVMACLHEAGDAVRVDQAGVGQVGVGRPDDAAQGGEVDVGEDARPRPGHHLVAEEGEGGEAGSACIHDGRHAAAHADRVGL